MKAKRRLSNFDFSKKGCHVSIVTSEVGGPANGKTALLWKGLDNINEEQMTQEVEMIEKSAHEQLVLKAVQEALEPVQKALADAVEELNVFKAAQVAAKEESRKDALSALMGKDNPDLESEFALLKSLDDATFGIVLKSKKDAFDALEKSMMFKEVGVSGEAEVVETENATMSILKKQYSK